MLLTPMSYNEHIGVDYVHQQ